MDYVCRTAAAGSPPYKGEGAGQICGGLDCPTRDSTMCKAVADHKGAQARVRG